MKTYTINTEFDASDKYIVDNIIARKSITLIIASPKKGKTALGLNLGICINEGIDFLENKVCKTKVVYYCNELSGKLIQERIKRLDIPAIYFSAEPLGTPGQFLIKGASMERATV